MGSASVTGRLGLATIIERLRREDPLVER